MASMTWLRPCAMCSALALTLAACELGAEESSASSEADAAADLADASASREAAQTPSSATQLDPPSGAEARADSSTKADSSSAAAYELCDGSDEIRLAFQHGPDAWGGPMHHFVVPYGHRFLFVTGRCEFVFGDTHKSSGAYLRGALAQEQAAQLVRELKLNEMSGSNYFDGGCADAPVLALMTPSGYAECSCGCDPEAPEHVAQAMNNVESAFWLLSRAGTPVDGPLDLLVVELDKDEPWARSPLSTPGPLPWPFSFAPGDVSVPRTKLLQHTQSSMLERSVRTLSGEDARIARSLRFGVLAAARNGASVFSMVGDKRYEIYLRERVDSKLALQVEAFFKDHDPRRARPLKQCSSPALSDVRYTSADFYDSALLAATDGASTCGLAFCWSGSFEPSGSARVLLQTEREADARPCLGFRNTRLSTDLTPIVDAFRGSYPGALTSVQLHIAGYPGELVLGEPRGGALLFTFDDSGQNVSLKPGERFEVSLETFFPTPFETPELSSDAVRLLGERPAASGVEPSGGVTQTFVFEAVQPGIATLRILHQGSPVSTPRLFQLALTVR